MGKLSIIDYRSMETLCTCKKNCNDTSDRP